MTETHGWNPWFVTLAVVGAINAAISAGYYLRLVAIMYFRPQRQQDGALVAEGGPGAGLALVASALLVLAVGLAPGAWMTAATRAGRSAVTHSLDAKTASVERQLAYDQQRNGQYQSNSERDPL